ncbi:MAG: hypothetical protein WDA47_04975 [Bacilli bacterium]|jgi:hypothetical protein
MEETNEKIELIQAIAMASSLKSITNSKGWKIIEDYMDETLKECQDILEDDQNKDLSDIQGARRLIRWIKDFREMIENTEISAEDDMQELEKINRKEKNTNGKAR